ncbi:MAG: helix-turn-helix domain-containing protein [Flavisolibacter sp.]
MINNLLLVLSLSGFVFGIMACCILLFSNKTHIHANRLLATALICLVATMLVTFLFEWNVELYAYIYRFPSPLLYLLFPASYLYIRTVINDETRLKKTDILHFLMSILYFIEILPHYFTSYEYRLRLVRELIKNPNRLMNLNEGFLPATYHTILLGLQAILYMFLILRIVYKGSRLKEDGIYIRKTSSFQWIRAFTILIGINFLPMLIFLLSPPSFIYHEMQFVLVVLSLSFLFINLYLFFRPEILYGIPQNLSAKRQPQEAPVFNIADQVRKQGLRSEENQEITPVQERRTEFFNLERYKPLLDSYMNSAKPFLRQGYSINELSRETGIPQHHLSALINRIYEMRFNEFLNRLRINYISENFKNPEWEKLTLEGIAKQAGFTSRTTFFNAIKKSTGLSPSEFIAQIRRASSQTSI